MALKDQPEYQDRVQALRGVHGLLTAKAMVRKAMLLEELDSISADADLATRRLAAVIREMING